MFSVVKELNSDVSLHIKFECLIDFLLKKSSELQQIAENLIQYSEFISIDD